MKGGHHANGPEILDLVRDKFCWIDSVHQKQRVTQECGRGCIYSLDWLELEKAATES